MVGHDERHEAGQTEAEVVPHPQDLRSRHGPGWRVRRRAHGQLDRAQGHGRGQEDLGARHHELSHRVPERRRRQVTPAQAGFVDGRHDQVHGGRGEGQSQGLVGVSGVEGVELRVRRVDEDSDTPGPGRAADPFHDEEDAQDQHDPGGEQHHHLRQDHGEPGEHLDGAGEHLEARVVRADRQHGVGDDERVVVEHPRQVRPVDELVEPVEDERAPQDVRHHQAHTQHDADADPLAPCRCGARQPPGARDEDDDEPGEEERDNGTGVPGAGQGVGQAVEEDPPATIAATGPRRAGGAGGGGGGATGPPSRRPTSGDGVWRGAPPGSSGPA